MEDAVDFVRGGIGLYVEAGDDGLHPSGESAVLLLCARGEG
jgi:hypothetical protein